MNNLSLLLVAVSWRWDKLLIFFTIGFLVRSTTGIGIAIPTTTATVAILTILTQNLPPNLGPRAFILFKVRIESEHIQHFLLLQVIIIQTNLEHDLIIGFHKIQFGYYGGIVLKVGPTILDKSLHLVLNAFADSAIVQQTAEPFHHGTNTRGTNLGQGLPDRPHEGNGHLDGIIRRITIEQHRQELQAEQLVRHSLIEQLSQEVGRGDGLRLIPPLVAPLELQYRSA
mmetsp:Transcript_29845/g.60569  ORF Transcript_29845/g.60569 Transcript_29845/m.60569 type:complete len:227 (+) Transcript_29845:3153-3833(+)